MAYEIFTEKSAKKGVKKIRRRSYRKDLGVLAGERIPSEALQQPELVSDWAQDFLRFCDEQFGAWE